ncbi:MAG: ABC transporter ATP-binding protein [Candidatus Eremiobacteraeota bacterium]|nr:ABC transporter ATP-binding protein [Candidatus Eremiobacteraeota bacterium]
MIEARGLCLQIAQRPLLREVHFLIRPGELVAILGPNGAGKTTLLRAIAGMHAIDAGSLLLDGTALSQYNATERAQRIAFMISEDTPIESVTVRDAVAAGRYAHHRWWEWREHERDTATIEAALAAVGMSTFATRDFETLSSGERQRVWLAIGLAQEAQVLLLDEPTSHLDIRVSHDILHLLRIQARSGKSVVCVLHDMNEALEYADRIMVLGDGGVLAFDTPEMIVQSGCLEAAYGMRLSPLRTSQGALRVFAVPKDAP